MGKCCEVKKLVKLYVTPRLLHAWAKLAENYWKEARCGQSVIFHQFIVDEDIELALCLNQNELDMEEKHRKENFPISVDLERKPINKLGRKESFMEKYKKEEYD